MSFGDGPGVPEALPRMLRLISDQLGARTIDRIWIFPPLVKGRREWGLVVVSRRDALPEVPDAPHARRVYTAVYEAERTGQGLTVVPEIIEEGTAPQDRLPRVVAGVVRRSGGGLGDPREVSLAGSPETFEALLAEFKPEQEGLSASNPPS